MSDVKTLCSSDGKTLGSYADGRIEGLSNGNELVLSDEKYEGLFDGNTLGSSNGKTLGFFLKKE